MESKPAAPERRRGIDRSRYDQEVVGKVTAKKSFTIEDMEGKDEEFLWPTCFNGRKYFAGFSDGEDISLFYRNEKGQKVEERIKSEKFPLTGDLDSKKFYGWYFVVKKEELDDMSPRARKILLDLVRKASGRILNDPISVNYYRIYARMSFYQSHAQRISGRELLDSIYVRNEKPVIKWGKRLYQGSIQVQVGGDTSQASKFFSGEAVEKRVTFNEIQKRVLDVIRFLEKYNVTYYEADLTPRVRFTTDHDIFIENNLRGLFIDLETDDTVSGFENLEEKRILSIGHIAESEPDSTKIQCWIGDPYWKGITEKEKLAIEKKLLLRFAKYLDSFECLYAWNGFNFDYPVLRERFKFHKIDYDWRTIVWIDLLAVWRRYFQRGASVNTSFSLDNIGFQVLKKGKLKRHNRRIIDLYTGTKEDRQLLIDYNKRDVEILSELEKFTGFGKIDQTFCRIGNCFPQDYHISTKIDGLMLKKGRRAGFHFPTRKYYPRVGYTGALVLDPIVGMHEGVANYDFASLYPSMMITFNISPDTYLDDEGVKKYPDHIVSPSGARFRKDIVGYIPQMFQHTLVKRKKYTELQKKEVVGSDMFLLYFRLAYSFKRLGLSFYGELGNNRSRFYNPILAEAVTLAGQHFLKYTTSMAAERNFKPLYGDTDSMFIKIDKDKADGFAAFCNSHFKEHCVEKFNIVPERCNIDLEYENYFDRIFFMTKKRYAGIMTMYKGQNAEYVEVKGLELMRSDGLQYVRTLQKKLLDYILKEGKSENFIYRVMRKERRLVLGGKLSKEDVIITQAITKKPGSYKSSLAHVAVAKKMIKDGRDFFVGMKIPYIVMVSTPKIVGIHELDWDPEKHNYDVLYYWNKKCWPAIERIVECVYPKIDWKEFYVNKKEFEKED